MKDNDIIKALQHCKREAGKHDCKNCPYVASKGLCCTTNMLNDTIDLINHQKDEIEKLNSKIKDLYKEIERIALMTVPKDIQERF